jgi:hypothetical protein
MQHFNKMILIEEKNRRTEEQKNRRTEEEEKSTLERSA